MIENHKSKKQNNHPPHPICQEWCITAQEAQAEGHTACTELDELLERLKSVSVNWSTAVIFGMTQPTFWVRKSIRWTYPQIKAPDIDTENSKSFFSVMHSWLLRASCWPTWPPLPGVRKTKSRSGISFWCCFPSCFPGSYVLSMIHNDFVWFRDGFPHNYPVLLGLNAQSVAALSKHDHPRRPETFPSSRAGAERRRHRRTFIPSWAYPMSMANLKNPATTLWTNLGWAICIHCIHTHIYIYVYVNKIIIITVIIIKKKYIYM